MATDQDTEQQILATIDKWVEQELRPIAREFDQADEYPAELVEQMKALGLFGATIGEQYGGLGLSATTYARVVSRICQVWMAPSGIFNSHLIMANCVERGGTEAQKEYFLPKFASGELRGGIGLTEPDAGSDLQGIRLTARQDGDRYLLNGTKTWITNGIQGNCLAVLTKTDPAAEPRHRGMSLFLCEKGPGFSVGKKLKKLGYRAIDSAELIFEDFSVSRDNLIGGEEGRGFQQIAGGLELGRINIAARGAGMAKGATDMALAYAMERKTFGKAIAEHQAVQLKLAEMSTRAAAAALLVEQAASKFDGGERCDLEAGQAKFFASEAAVQNS
ncbi:MAG: acyl-CoA dehydrogenase family protein, partial [Luminiphilus sp.]